MSHRKALICLLLGISLVSAGCVPGTPVLSPPPTQALTLPPVPTPTAAPVPTPTQLPPTPAPSPVTPGALPQLPFAANGPQAWCWQEALGLVDSLMDLSFVDARTGWAVGQGGTILHTADAGTTWEQQYSSADVQWQRVIFVDPQQGWAFGTDAERHPLLLKTADGGRTWSEQRIPPRAPALWIDMAWPDPNSGWLTADTGLWHTSDGGVSWQRQSYPSQYVVNSVFGLDARHAWITTGYDVLRTTDGGNRWTLCYSGDLWWEKLVFVDSQAGWGIAQDGTIAHTTDGGLSWKVQYRDHTANGRDIGFLDARNGWALGIHDRGTYLLVTTDGGKSWQKRTVPTMRTAAAFVDPQHGWAVGYPGWWSEPRHSIAYTEDGGQSWQFQDTHIVMPSLAGAAADHFSALLQQPNPPLDALVLLLFPGQCSTDDRALVDRALHNLGWNGSELGEPPQERQDLAVERVDADLDGDGEPEATLYGGNGEEELFLGVLDWTGHQWQLAWLEPRYSRYSGNVRATLPDLNGDGRPELQVEWLTHPSSGTGFLEQVWEIEVLSCAPGFCRRVWTAELGHLRQGCGGYQRWHAWTERAAQEYRLIPPQAGAWPDIQVRTYGVKGVIEQTRQPLTTSLEINLSAALQQTYHWTGSTYTLTAQAVLTPERVLDTQPLTETLDLDGDGEMERAVFRYSQDCGGIWHILFLYEMEQAEPIGVFSATVTGAPTPSLSLTDVDGDGAAEVVNCSTAFLPVAWLPAEWVWLLPPRCVVEEVSWK